jgi:hypothetical protein
MATPAAFSGVSSADPAGKPFELVQPQCALKVAQTVIEAQVRHVVQPRTLLSALEVIRSHTVIPETTHLVRAFETFRCDHSTLAGSHGLYRMETENA